MNKSMKLTTLAAAVALAMGSGAAFAAAPAATQLPGQGAVTGSATFDATNSNLPQGVMDITVGGNAVINWGAAAGAGPTGINPKGTAGFNIGSGAEVNFNGTTGAVLNIDSSGNASQIFGTLQSLSSAASTTPGDGGVSIFVANANGIIVGAGATIATSGDVGLIGNTLVNGDGTQPYLASSYAGGTPNYAGSGGDVTVQTGASITGTSILVSGGGAVNVDLGKLAGDVSLQAGLQNSSNALVEPNPGASLTVSGALPTGSTWAQFNSQGDATVNGTLSGITFAADGTSDVAGTFTNNGLIGSTATPDAFGSISGDLVNNGTINASGAVNATNLTNAGTFIVTGAAGDAWVQANGGDLTNNGTLTAADGVYALDGSIVNAGQLNTTLVRTLSDGIVANGFASGANYSITNTGTITSTGDLELDANVGQTGGPASNPNINGSTGGIHSTGTLQLGLGGALTAYAFNNVQLLGAVQVPGAKPNTFVNTSATRSLSGLDVEAGDYSDFGEFASTGGVTINPSIFSTGTIWTVGNTVELMGNIGGFDASGDPLATTLNVIAGAAPDTGYAVRVAAGMTASAGTVNVDGDTTGDVPNVILQGQLAGPTVNIGQTNVVGDVFSGPNGGITADTLNIDSNGRVKTAPYLNGANFRYNYLPVSSFSGSGVDLTLNADSQQGTPTSGYNLLVDDDVNLTSTWTGVPPVYGAGTAVTGVNVVPNSHFVLQSTGNIATVGDFYWPGYIYLGNIAADSDGNAMPGTLGVGTIALGGSFSNVLPGDINGASGIHFITQFPLSMGGFTVTTNANAWVNFGSDALTQLYSGQNGATGPFFGGVQGPGKVINYGPLAPANFVTQAPVSAQ